MLEATCSAATFHELYAGARRARASMDPKGNPKGGRAGARRRPLGISSRPASNPEVSEGVWCDREKKQWRLPVLGTPRTASGL